MTSQFDYQLNQAAQLEQSGRLDEAAALYQSLRHERPGDNRPWMMNALLDLRRGNAAGTVSTLESYLALQDSGQGSGHDAGPEMLALLAAGYRAVDRIENALDCWQRYLSMAPGDPKALHEFGSCQLLAGDREAADATFKQFVESQNASPESLLATALAYHTAGIAEPAADLYRRTLAASPGMQLARRNLAAIHQVQGDFDKAETLYRTVIAAEPGNFEVIENLGTLYKDQNRLEEAMGCYANAMRLRRAIPQGDLRQLYASDTSLAQTSLHSLILQVEQLDYLIEIGKIDGSFKRHRDAMTNVIKELEQNPSGGHRLQLSADQFCRIGYTLSRLVHLEPTNALPGGALNPDLDTHEIETNYKKTKPGATWIDNMLRPEALKALRDYCLRSSIWFDFGKAGGYSGAYLQHGFGNQLLLQIANELRAAFPGILGPHVLNQMWAYIYDSQMSGITVHADKAAVNLNFWITPDDANLDSESGGLVVYTKEAPAEWSFSEYNNKPAEIEAFVSDSESIKVPHRCNRAVLFHSNLFHKTDDFSFKKGLENRRINITMLFGEREEA